MDRFLTEHASKKASERSYVGYVRRFRTFFGNDTPLTDITPRLIEEYKNRLFASELAPGSVNRHLVTLKKAFNLATREWEWCQKNPVLSVSMEREPMGRDRWLIVEEEDRLVGACAEWLRGVVVFALGTGMRMGEILALTWRDVDQSRKIVTVCKSKNGERRALPLNQTVQNVMKERAKVRSLQTDIVFPSQAHTTLEGSHLRRAFRRALKKARIHDFRFHDLRHTFATRLIQLGADLYKVQRLLGHKSPMMTQRYAHHYPESMRESVEMLDRIRPLSQIITGGADGLAVEAI